MRRTNIKHIVKGDLHWSRLYEVHKAFEVVEELLSVDVIRQKLRWDLTVLILDLDLNDAAYRP